MAKELHQDLYNLWDIVIINKIKCKITKVYPQEKCYRVTPIDPNVRFCWNEFYPHHSDISGLSED